MSMKLLIYQIITYKSGDIIFQPYEIFNSFLNFKINNESDFFCNHYKNYLQTK